MDCRLYDLVQDPREQLDRMASVEFKGIADPMMVELQRWFSATRARGHTVEQPTSEQALELLRRAGYLEAEEDES